MQVKPLSCLFNDLFVYIESQLAWPLWFPYLFSLGILTGGCSVQRARGTQLLPRSAGVPLGQGGAKAAQRGRVRTQHNRSRPETARRLNLLLELALINTSFGYRWEHNRKGSIVALFYLPMAEEGSVPACAVWTFAIAFYYYSYFAFAKRGKSFRLQGSVLEQCCGAVGTGPRHWHVFLICCQFSWCWATVAPDLSPPSRAAKCQHIQAVCWAFLSLLWSRRISSREPLLKPPSYFCAGDCA